MTVTFGHKPSSGVINDKRWRTGASGRSEDAAKSLIIYKITGFVHRLTIVAGIFRSSVSEVQFSIKLSGVQYEVY